ncbi:dienelactone hydrolase family protein [Rufibacter glacialis]|uniref:Dienelactone hydrolase family protein n=1 Tax=Rufibacter glacialis TaxID=1259555 RepID=A0A5M8QRN8_9BACT|nr:dienelactone hydrolase family protein [Rufibacter glacialis]KAA6437654.1 dienelactone hydrolase family protein [Rufibacter glacialis]GGK57465.1 dienelactone hydrolase [Rufibacter glacialis]
MKKLSFTIVFLLAMMALAASAQQIKTQVVEYKEGNTTLEGYMAYDPSRKGKLPAVLVVHEWNGLSDYTRKRCDQLARMGYVAFAADIYGKGVRPKTAQESGAEAGKYKNNVPLLRQRVNAALAQVKKQPNVDAARVAAIGYCFGGTTVLELARSGAEVAGVVSFHGGLATPSPADAQKIKAKVLVAHGAIDPFVPQTEVDAFFKEMNEAQVDYQFIAYSGAVHAFTNPEAGEDPKQGAAYHAAADRRSWEAMKLFFAEIFKK